MVKKHVVENIKKIEDSHQINFSEAIEKKILEKSGAKHKKETPGFDPNLIADPATDQNTSTREKTTFNREISIQSGSAVLLLQKDLEVYKSTDILALAQHF